MTNKNTEETNEKKPRIFGRIDEKTWQKWKRAAKKQGLTFTEWASNCLDNRAKRDAK